MNNKQIKIFILILLIVHLGISFSFYDDMGYGSEFAGSLLRIIKKIKLTFFALLFSGIIYLIYLKICKDLTKAKIIKIITLVVLPILSVVSYFFIAKNIVFPKHTHSPEEYLKLQTEKDNYIKTNIEAVLKKTKLFTPPDSILQKDKKELEKIIQKEWDNFYSPLMNERMIARINKLTSYNYDSTLKDSIVELNKRTTKVTYILYSPNFDYFIAILTYEVSNEPAEKYGHITLLGQKINSKIYSYAFTGTMQGGYGTSPSRNGAVYRGLSDVFYYWGIDPGDNNLYGFGRVLLKLKPSENPPSVDFWVSNGVKNLFQFKTDTTINIKYKSNINTKDSASVDWPIWVYTN